MRARWTLGLSLAAAACSGDGGFSFGEGAVRSLAILDGALVEYSAPPLREHRRLDLSNGADVALFLASDRVAGGFAATRWQPGSPATWTLERFGPDWSLITSRPGADIVGTDTSLSLAHFTQDGRFIVGRLDAPPLQGVALVVLDATTLVVVRRIPLDGRVFYGSSSGTGAGPGEVMLTVPGSSVLLWLDAATGLATDSASVPPGSFFVSAATHRRIYVTDPGGRLVLTDGAGSVLAARDSVGSSRLRLDGARDRLAAIVLGRVYDLDPLTLQVRKSIDLGLDGVSRVVRQAVLDPVTGALVATTGKSEPCEKGCPQPIDGVLIVDLSSGRVAREASPSPSLTLVP